MIEQTNLQTVLITGASGMIGSATVQGILAAGYRVIGIDRQNACVEDERYTHYVVDLADTQTLKQIISDHAVGRVIHLAALAHFVNGKDYTWEEYRHVNVDCAANVFEAADERPLLFISTVDVYGFTQSVVDGNTKPQPISYYAASKVLAETQCQKLNCYTIFRLSPVYTDTVKRDIQKRYYLKYPNIAYRIGSGTEYEILNINGAVKAMVDWCGETPQNDVRIIKDAQRMNTADYIRDEKRQGRAKFVVYLPRWMVRAGYAVLKAILGENKRTYLLHKAVFPLRSR